MAQSEPSQTGRTEMLLERLVPAVEQLSTDVEQLSTNVERLSADFVEVRHELARTNDRVEVYQKASQQVVNLAFGLILTSTLAIIISAVVNR